MVAGRGLGSLPLGLSKGLSHNSSKANDETETCRSHDLALEVTCLYFHCLLLVTHTNHDACGRGLERCEYQAGSRRSSWKLLPGAWPRGHFLLSFCRPSVPDGDHKVKSVRTGISTDGGILQMRKPKPRKHSVSCLTPMCSCSSLNFQRPHP